MDQSERMLFLNGILFLEATVIGLEAEVAKVRATLLTMKQGLGLETSPPVSSIDPDLLAKLKKPIDEVDWLTVRTYNCLKKKNVKTVGELVQQNKRTMLKIRDFGHKSLNEVTEMLVGMGLSLGMELTPEVLEVLKEG